MAERSALSSAAALSEAQAESLRAQGAAQAELEWERRRSALDVEAAQRAAMRAGEAAEAERARAEALERALDGTRAEAAAARRAEQALRDELAQANVRFAFCVCVLLASGGLVERPLHSTPVSLAWASDCLGSHIRSGSIIPVRVCVRVPVWVRRSARRWRSPPRAYCGTPCPPSWPLRCAKELMQWRCSHCSSLANATQQHTSLHDSTPLPRLKIPPLPHQTTQEALEQKEQQLRAALEVAGDEALGRDAAAGELSALRARLKISSL